MLPSKRRAREKTFNFRQFLVKNIHICSDAAYFDVDEQLYCWDPTIGLYIMNPTQQLFTFSKIDCAIEATRYRI